MEASFLRILFILQWLFWCSKNYHLSKLKFISKGVTAIYADSLFSTKYSLDLNAWVHLYNWNSSITVMKQNYMGNIL